MQTLHPIFQTALAPHAPALFPAAPVPVGNGVVIHGDVAAPKPTRHEQIAAKIAALIADVEHEMRQAPEQYLGGILDTLDALETAQAAWDQEPTL